MFFYTFYLPIGEKSLFIPHLFHLMPRGMCNSINAILNGTHKAACNFEHALIYGYNKYMCTLIRNQNTVPTMQKIRDTPVSTPGLLCAQHMTQACALAHATHLSPP